MLKRRKNQRGFTLIELIIVIAILGVLIAIIVPRFSGFTEGAKVRADESNVEILNSAAAMWATDLDNDITTVDIDKLDAADLIEKDDIKDPWGANRSYTATDGVFSTLGAPAAGDGD
ncbi:MAG: prepilin-type N-terminal cleavage/methylation domain-containing protein [Clostridia bacterium]|nr:prepilin-type N-terminal cleavage/methylation domain-containing protein [Clostridia bacterium]